VSRPLLNWSGKDLLDIPGKTSGYSVQAHSHTAHPAWLQVQEQVQVQVRVAMEWGVEQGKG
jgi:hypothetical protein